MVSRNGAASPSELRKFLRVKLPDYMVPAAFVTLEALPLTPNGKVDRKALPKPDFEALADESKFVASTPTEIVLARIWCEVLGLKHVGIHDNFFELGGHSLMAVRIFSEIKTILGKSLPLATLFQAPTVEKLAAALRETGWKPAKCRRRATIFWSCFTRLESQTVRTQMAACCLSNCRSGSRSSA
jgi:acyl carrier protein